MTRFNLFDFKKQGKLRECWRCNKWFESYKKKQRLEYCSFCEEFYELEREVKKLSMILKKIEEEKLEFEYFLTSNYCNLKEQFLKDLEKKEANFKETKQSFTDFQKLSDIRINSYKNEILELKQKFNYQNSSIEQGNKINEIEFLNEELSTI
ncbi:MAG: hypothetical protein AM1032_000315 [Mycoplasmataceae bacterium]|nr:MAG: hypothetical protein AM1032_000315 [Mycoplasmataceae bacterium]